MKSMGTVRIASFFLLLSGILPLQAQSGGGLDRAEAIGPYLNGTLPKKTPRPSTGSWKLVNAFPNLTFIDPVQMLPVPFSNRLLVLEKAGRLVVFEHREDVSTKTVLIDLRSQVESTHDSGMVGVAFHPEFGIPDSPNRHYLYVYYRYTPNKAETNRAYCRLSRLTWDPGSNQISPASEYVLINQYDRHNWHNGGGLFFGPEGFLYLSIGDEGGANDEFNTGQRMDTGLLAGVMRIDVDCDPNRSHPIRRQPRNPSTPPSGWPNSYSQGYYIPNDNPWQSPDGSRLEEFFAIGVRSPHRMTLDPVTGDIWLGDIGQNTQEEVSKIVKGGNYQWPYREGNVAGPKAKPASLIGFDVTPVYAYGRSQGGCVIGGYVYRGALHPELEGRYIFGDHNTGQIWSLTTQGNQAVVTSLLTMASHGPGPKRGLSSFGLDASGEIYVLSLAGTDLDGGRIYRLEKSNEGVPEPPRLLSQTGAFSNLSTLEAAPGLIPYDVIQPLWSDGAEKSRWVAIPNDGNPNSSEERIGWKEQGAWDFPRGTVLVKHFEYPGRRLETRFFVHGEDGVWHGFTYRWREDGSDAELLPGDPLDESIQVGGSTRTWHYPGRSECAICHNDAAGKPLGLRTHQLNRDFFYESTGRSANQLVTLNRLGFLSPSIDESRLDTLLTARHQSDSSASLERRARSYLDVNCSHCHQPAAPSQANFDARLQTPPWYQNLINNEPGNDFGIPGALLVAPGHGELSTILHRASSLQMGVAMPPIAKGQVDEAGMQLLADWIASLDPNIGPQGPVSGPPAQDHSAPLLTLSLVGGSTEVSAAFQVQLSTNEPILGLSLDDFLISNGHASQLQGSGSSWTFTVTPLAPGAGSITLPSDCVTDVHGNANEALDAPLLFVYQPSSGPVDLLSNGGFEAGIDAWDHGPRIEPTSEAQQGLGAVSIGASTWFVQTIPVEELKAYVYRGWAASSQSGVRAEAGLSFWDANGVWIHDRIVPLSPGPSWEAFELAFSAPVGARHVSVWILSNESGALRIDNLSVLPGGPGEPRPHYHPALTNLTGNGDFESGIAPWDSGGVISLSPDAHQGNQAVRLGMDGFIVQTKPARPGERIAFEGYYRTAGNGFLEVGFAFVDEAGEWITDRALILPESDSYTPFLIDTTVPEGSRWYTVWAWRASGGEAYLDALALFNPDEPTGPVSPNQLSNGDFEAGGLAPWDTGGSPVSLSSAARTGHYAARFSSSSFLVHNQAAGAGESFTFSGYYRTETPNPGDREAGFSFWGAQGEWLGDALIPLPPVGDYTAFSILGEAPAGTVSFSAWIWCGGNGDGLLVDDLQLVANTTPEAVGSSGLSVEPESLELGIQMAFLSLQSDRTLDLDDARRDANLGAVLGTPAPVVASGWNAASAHTVRTEATLGSRQSLATVIEGPGIVSARWRKPESAGRGVLRLLVNGKSRALCQANSDWETVSVLLDQASSYSIEFRFDPQSGGGVAELTDFRFLPGTPPLQPDLAIGRSGKRLLGRQLYNRNGRGQDLRAASPRRGSIKLLLQWRNDSPTIRDGARLSGSPQKRQYRLDYYRLRPQRQKVTAAVRLGRHETASLPPQASEDYRLQLRPAKGSQKRPLKAHGTFRASSVLDPRQADQVRWRLRP